MIAYQCDIDVKDCNNRGLWGTPELPPPPVGSLYPIALVGDAFPTMTSLAGIGFGMNGSTFLHISPLVPEKQCSKVKLFCLSQESQIMDANPSR
jgi:hypothetical protein